MLTNRDLQSMQKPTLQQIAEMPFPDSRQVLNHFYGAPEFEPTDEDQEFKVTVSYSWREDGTKTYRVWAKSAEEAEAAAEDAFDTDGMLGAEYEFEGIDSVEAVK